MRLAQTLQRRIEGGTYAPGTRVPSENQLVQAFGMPRPTVVRALGLLKRDGWLEPRRGFVLLLSDGGVPLEVISRLVVHFGTAVTGEVCRKQIRPVIQTGAVVMDGILGADLQRP